MASVLYGPMVTALHGSIGGTTFQDNPSGSIARARPRPPLSPTSKQTYAETWPALILKSWNARTLMEQAAWNTFASANTKVNRYGQTKTLTGFNWYGSLNYFHFFYGYALLTSPPTLVLPTPPVNFTIITTGAALQIQFSPAFNPPNEDLYLLTTAPVRSFSTSVRSYWRATALLSGAPFGTINITAAWEAAHGLTWSTIYPNSQFFLYAMVMTVELASYITSVGNIQRGSTP